MEFYRKHSDKLFIIVAMIWFVNYWISKSELDFFLGCFFIIMGGYKYKKNNYQ